MDPNGTKLPETLTPVPAPSVDALVAQLTEMVRQLTWVYNECSVCGAYRPPGAEDNEGVHEPACALEALLVRAAQHRPTPTDPALNPAWFRILKPNNTWRCSVWIQPAELGLPLETEETTVGNWCNRPAHFENYTTDGGCCEDPAHIQVQKVYQ